MKTIFYTLILISIVSVSCDKDDPFDEQTGTFTDKRDGQVYEWVKIGEQIWMAENLRTTKYNDGTSIPYVADSFTWRNLSTPAYCWYDDDENKYKKDYGGLYNWYSVNTGKLCPKGWHIPTQEEWDTLINFLGGDQVAGGKMKEFGIIHWNSPNYGATNESGFTALPGGIMMTKGTCRSIGVSAYCWSANEFDDKFAWAYVLGMSIQGITSYHPLKSGGLSVRCIKDQVKISSEVIILWQFDFDILDKLGWRHNLKIKQYMKQL